jgi:hypothetical protein
MEPTEFPEAEPSPPPFRSPVAVFPRDGDVYAPRQQRLHEHVVPAGSLHGDLEALRRCNAVAVVHLHGHGALLAHRAHLLVGADHDGDADAQRVEHGDVLHDAL